MIEDLVAKMRDGSIEARRELIELHVGLAFSVAKDYKDDEALSNALCELVHAVDQFRLSGHTPAALSGYLKVALTRAAGAPKREDLRHQVRIKRQSSVARRWREDGSKELLETIIACCETDLDVAIVYNKVLGYTGSETARILGVSASTVSILLRNIELRHGARVKLSA